MGTPVPEATRRAYAEALYEAHLPAGSVVLSVAGPPRGAVDALPADTLTVVTAYNPGAARPSPEENERAQQRLAAHLAARGWTFFPAVGYSRDRSHEEPSFAVVGLDRPQAAALGRAFGQAAVFYWDGAAGELIWCA